MQTTSILNSPLYEKIVFALSVAALLFWISAWYLIEDIYRVAIVGALYELTSMLMLALIIILPVVSFIQFRNSRYKMHRIPFYSLLLNIILLLLFVVQVMNE